MKTNKAAALSQPEKLVRRRASDIRAYAKSPAAKETSKRLRERGSEPSAADLKEIAELTDDELSALYRPLKAPVTVRIDADVLAWLKAKGGRYQSHLNAMLRSCMLAERKN